MNDTMVIPDFVSIVGSVAEGREPNDIDVLMRAELSPDRRYVMIQAESLVLALRDHVRRLVGSDELEIHPLFAAQGPHDRSIALGDLVVRWHNPEIRDVQKESPVRINLGCGEDVRPGYLNFDCSPRAPGVIGVDLTTGIPLAPESVDEVLASHFLEHLQPEQRIPMMREIHRVLKPGGVLIAVVPHAESAGAEMPFHLSSWTEETFRAFCNEKFISDYQLPPFEEMEIRRVERGPGVVDVVAVLRKPAGKEPEGVSEIEKGRRLWPKPAVRFYTEHATPGQLWEAWGATRVPFAVEPKLNGFRCQVEKRGDDVRVFFEDTETDRTAVLAPLVERLRKIHHSFVIDADLGIEENGRRWPRPALAALLGKSFDWEGREPVLTAFDIMELDGKDLKELPFSERRRFLERLLGKTGMIVPQQIVHSEDQLERAFQRFSKLPQSEGVVTKTLDAPYPDGPTQEWAKVKVRLEVRVRVTDKRTLKNGMKIYLCEWADGGQTGWTMPTNIEANRGDVLTVATPELNRVKERSAPGGWTVTWTNGTVQDVTKDPPYARRQALILAARYIATAKGSYLPAAVPGSKWVLAKAIIPRLYPNHSRFVDAYTGSGAILFRKPRSEEEHVNDLNDVRWRTLRFYQRGSREDFKRLLERDYRPDKEKIARLASATPSSDAEAAYASLYTKIHSRIGVTASRHSLDPFHNPAFPTLDDCLRWHNRLQGVNIHHIDALELIRRLDSPGTLFYLDPPYPTADDGLYDYKAAGHFDRLLELLKSIKGKFILSCHTADIAGKKLPSGWHVKRVPHHWIAGTQHRRVYEVLIANYDMDAAERENRKFFRQHGRYPWEPELRSASKETRGEIGEEYWERNWFLFYPSRKGKFVLQHHWRGLSEDELDLPEEELLRRGHSVHADLRFTSPMKGRLWGIHVFYESDRDGLPVDQISSLKVGEALRGGPKLPEPEEWFDIARNRRYTAEPGEAGSTSKTYSVIIERDRGTYEAGVWNRHLVEIVLQGKIVRGRFTLQRGGEEQLWFFKRAAPAPIAAREKLESVIRRLRERGHKLLIWARPGQLARMIRLKRSRPSAAVIGQVNELVRRASLGETPIAFRVVGDYIVVVSSNNFEDTDGEIVTRKSILEYVQRGPGGTIRFWHLPGTDFADVVGAIATPHYLIHVGKFRHDKVGQSFRRFLEQHPDRHPTIAPLGWGTSMRFVGVRSGNDYVRIHHIETSVLPLHRAANPWVPLDTAKGGDMDQELVEALAAIADDPEVLQQIIAVARAAEERADELDPVVAAKSAKTFARQLRKVAESLEGRAAERLGRLADDVEGAEESEFSELAGRVRKIAGTVKDEKLKKRLEQIAAKMEEEGLGSYGYAYPEPKKEADDDLRSSLDLLSARVEEVAKSLAELRAQVDQAVSGLTAQVEEVRAKSALPVPSMTADRPVAAPAGAVQELLRQIVR